MTVYGADLAKVVEDELSGDLKRVFVSILTGNREEDRETDAAKVAKDAQDLYDVSTFGYFQ